MTLSFSPSKVLHGRCRIIGAAVVAVCLAAVSLQSLVLAKGNEPTAEKVAETPTDGEAEKAQAVAEAEAITEGKPKRKRSKSREPVAVA